AVAGPSATIRLQGPCSRMDAYRLRLGSFLLGGVLLLAAACAGPSPRSPGADLVDIAAIDPSIRLDLRYATADNFTGVAVYPVARCLLRRDAAERLARVQRRLRAEGVGLVVWDCYRPLAAQAR